MTTPTRILTGVALTAFVFAASGCLITTGSSINEYGTLVTQKTLDQIVLGATSEAWVIATLGEPTDVTTVDGDQNVRILTYEHTVERDSGGTVLFLIAAGSETKSTQRAYFEITDGVVTRHWIEGS